MLSNDRFDDLQEQTFDRSARNARSSFAQWADVPIAAPAAEPVPHVELKHADALLELRQLADPEIETGVDAEAWHLPPPGLHTTGTQLRRQLVTSESIAELAAVEKLSLLQKLARIVRRA